MQWKITYGDGSTFSSEDGIHYEAPSRDVQFIKELDDEVGFQIHSRADFYMWNPRMRQWQGSDQGGVVDFALEFGMVDILTSEVFPGYALLYYQEGNPDLIECDFTGLCLHMEEDGYLKLGRHMTNMGFRALEREVNADPDFPKKSAWYRHERP